ncbi:MAG: uncharacterized protein JWM71_2367 [Solirubrobacteraceae bacterium]|nr:uncharacterized protein [Solirubrobacteraceae bacterium]
MVWVNWGGRRPRGYGGGYGGGYGRGPFGGGYGRYGRGGGGGGGCLRDVFLLETGCCLAEMLGCGPQLVLLAPAAASLLRAPRAGTAPRAEQLIRLYQSRISAKRTRPCCRMTPSCSEFAIEALHQHGTLRGLRLTAGRILRCRPGGSSGPDPVPPALP